MLFSSPPPHSPIHPISRYIAGFPSPFHPIISLHPPIPCTFPDKPSDRPCNRSFSCPIYPRRVPGYPPKGPSKCSQTKPQRFSICLQTDPKHRSSSCYLCLYDALYPAPLSCPLFYPPIRSPIQSPHVIHCHYAKPFLRIRANPISVSRITLPMYALIPYTNPRHYDSLNKTPPPLTPPFPIFYVPYWM